MTVDQPTSGNSGSEATDPLPVGTIQEPVIAGTSAKYHGGKPFRKYMSLYALASVGIFAIWGGVGGLLLPNQVQGIEFPHFFGGMDVDLTVLSNLKSDVAAGKVVATAEQLKLLDLYAQFDAARARNLSLIAAIGVFVTMFIQPIAGVLSDRTRSGWGRRAPWIAGGAVLGALLLVGLRYSNTIILMAIFWSMAQLVINAAQGPLTATVADRVPDSRLGTASGISGLGLMVGALIGGVLAGVLFTIIGLDAYYPFIVGLVAFALLFVVFERDRSSKQLVTQPLHLGRFLASFLIPLRDPDYRWVWIAKFVMSIGFSLSTAFSLYMLQSYVQPALTLTQANQTAPLLSLAGFPFMLAAMMVSGKWSDKIRRRKPFVFWASVILGLSMIIPFLWPSVPALFIQAMIGNIGLGAWLVVDQALFIDVIPDKTTVGRDLGVAALGGNFGQALGPVFAGQLVAITGGYRMVWALGIVVVLVAAAAILPVKRVA